MEKRISQRKRNRQGIRESEKKSGKKPLIFAILVLVVVFGATQVRDIARSEKRKQNEITIQKLESDIAEEEQRKQELQDYEAYIKTKEFIEQMAREKLGLIYPGELIFQPVDPAK